MKQYEIKKTKDKEVRKIICNGCGKQINVENGRLTQDVLQIEKRWSYPSEKDNEVHSFDLCEECYDKLIETFCIPIERK